MTDSMCLIESGSGRDVRRGIGESPKIYTQFSIILLERILP